MTMAVVSRVNIHFVSTTSEHPTRNFNITFAHTQTHKHRFGEHICVDPGYHPHSLELSNAE